MRNVSRLAPLLLMFAWAFFALGCGPAQFERPIGDPKAPATAPELLGFWVALTKEGKLHALCITEKPDHSLLLAWVHPAERPFPRVARGFVARVRGRPFLNLQMRLAEDMKTRTAQFDEPYFIFTYDLATGSRIQLAYLTDQSAGKLVDAGVWTGTRSMDVPRSLLVTSTPEQVLQTIFSRPASASFGIFDIFHKVEPPAQTEKVPLDMPDFPRE